MDIREFAVMVKKSGVSIDKCAKVFRMAQLLKYLGIRKNNKIGDWDYDDAKENSSFIQVKRYNCKKLGIHSEIVSTWIKDLLDCYSYDLDNSVQTSDRNFLE